MRYIWFVCICLTIGISGFWYNTLRNDPKYIYEPPWYRGHLRDISEHYQTIAKHLKTYHDKQGRYPDNNEGLTILTDLRKELVDKQTSLPSPMGTYEDKFNWGYYIPKYAEMVSFDGGILSPWFEPFIYENRNGLDETLFTDSPVNYDKERSYCIEVDKGIYVYSMGAVMYYQKYCLLLKEKQRNEILQVVILIVGPILTLIFIWLFIRAKKVVNKPRPLWRTLKWVGSVILVLISLGSWSMVTITTCYVMTSFGLHSRPRMIKEYNALLEKYHQRGVINQQTYQKIKTALDDVNKLIEDNKIK